MAQKISITKYKKIIMLILVVVAAIVCIAATYITEYNINKVTREDVFTTEMTKTYKSADEFLENFTEFKIVLDKVVEPYEETLGKHTFMIETEAAETSQLKSEIKVSIALGADWIKYISEIQNRNVTIGKDDQSITIKNIDTKFPAKSNLLFTPKVQPKLYAMVEWSEKDGYQYYTYLEFDYNEYAE